ncbi:MAG: SMC family ATPase [Streptomycetaceae bacterium]|nr:SMC family ATPase [Streptomycetaceae bacterium]
MRLHRMTLTAFGPFPGTTTIDFDDLSAAGLFLLHGPTGAGKTSVLDAVCYALYGGVPGARQGMRLRSDHADPHTLTEVELELTAGGRRLRLTRRPEQLRPKKRGTGTTVEKAFVAMSEAVTSASPCLPGAVTASREHPLKAGGQWKGLSRSHQEIGEEITQLLGMNREQFCQVVLLPQGDFARFLRADASERGVLLGRLFETNRFAAAEEWLAEQRRLAEMRVRGHDEQLIALAHRMRQAAGTTDDEHPLPQTIPGDPGLAGHILGWAAIARADAREQADIAHLALAAAEAAHRAAERTLEQAVETDRLQRRHAAAIARAAALDAEEQIYQDAQAALERARAADLVAPALAVRDAARREHEVARAAEHAARDLLPAPWAGTDAAELAEAARRAGQDLGCLAAAQRAEQRCAALRRERDTLDREAAADEAADQEAAAWLADWDAVRTAHQQRIDAAHRAAARAEQLAAALETTRERLEAARRRDTLADEERDADRRLLHTREAATIAHERWLELKERRLRGIAAELAAQLKEDDPCAVCGSTEHPAPALPGAGHVDRAAEESAHAAYQAAQSARERADTALHTVREQLAAARAAAGDRQIAALTAELDDATKAHAAVRKEADQLPAIRAELEHVEREHATRVDELQHARSRTAARTARREALERELASLRAEVAELLPDTTTSMAELKEHARLLAEAADAARTASATALRLQQAEAQLAEAAGHEGFATPREAAEAAPDETTRRSLRERIERHLAERSAVAAELADHDVRSAAASPPAALDKRRAQLEAATRALTRACTADSAARARCTQLDRLSAEAARHTTELAPLREEHVLLRRLSYLAAGTSSDNQLRMRLESYVLAARLEQVAAAASIRLHRMSSGRYTLLHTDARSGGRGRSGLGLQVLDAWTGTARDTATLSGGETFFASLALALGLADVVTDEVGGIRLDTLFIDEGFGSLDDQTLDEVLDVLDQLRERDRAVGIVSHVADLRHRIPAQLQVVKERHGSVVRHRTTMPHHR